MSKKALLIICDGWGIGDKGKDDVIFNTPTPYWDELLKTYPASQLQASGENVGLPDGQMGNSEVGHLNIGAGRIVYQDLVKINIACRENTIMENPEIKRAYSYAKENNKQIHFMGLVSDGGVHSHNTHLYGLLELAKRNGLSNVYVHCFLDGRDTAPTSGKEFIEELEAKMGAAAIEQGKAFLEENKKKPGVVTLPSGLQYEVINEGTGKKAKATDQVKCHYEGTLIDGTLFDSSIKRGEPAVFGVNQVIPGWVEALQLMPEGSKWKLYIPSDLAYGARGAGEMIPPHSTLVFEVELLEVL